jgi:hypothetical protein
MAKRWGIIVAAVGFISACVGLAQAFSFDHLQVIRCEYDGPAMRSSNMAECVNQLTSNVAQVVDLRLSMYSADGGYENADYTRPFARHELADAVQWTFTEDTFAHEVAGSTTHVDRGDLRILSYDTSAIAAHFPDYQRLKDQMAAFPSGIILEVPTTRQTANPFSRVELVKGLPPDVLEGPFQISVRQVDETIVLTVSPAPMTDHLAAEVRCAKRDWPMWLKFLACPFT